MSEWQPIETAPKDGTKILVFVPDDYSGRSIDPPWSVYAVYWYIHNGETFAEVGDGLYRKEPYQTTWWEGAPYTPLHPTHWMPLPAPPAQRDMEAGR